jgi:hypothetical protein
MTLTYLLGRLSSIPSPVKLREVFIGKSGSRLIREYTPVAYGA